MSSRLPTAFILITVMIDAMGIGIIIPVMPELIMDIDGGTLASASLWGGVLTSLFAVMQFLFGPMIGNLSDRFGRRPILLSSLLILALDYLVMAVAHAMWLLVLGRLVGGIMAATQSTAAAFMADTSPPEKRGAGFGLVSAAFGMGFVLGPVIGGFLGDLGPRAPFHAAATLAFANFLFGWAVLPETITPDRARPFVWARANPFGALRQIRALPGLGRLLVVLLLYQLAFNVYPAVWSYFTTAAFGWDPSMIGLSLGIFGISIFAVQAGLIGLAISRLGEAGTVVLALGFAILSFAVLGVISNGWLALALTPVSALAAMCVPALQAIMSRRTPHDAQGELQGIFTSVGALAMIISPLMMTNIFAAFTHPDAPLTLPGAPFLAALVLVALGLVLFLTRKRHASADYVATGRNRP
ncbi:MULTISPECIES: TCR/Tet family MFS transporter [unclassified Roseovarius]|uniref:TCR/Tet family MFS transporter n=1 Tax=unclassified Roseovarius TaxID=2614913 RepID=UPI00273E5AA7|nr:TCR/Tet family MFS transporter [Roseovarius sp. MMSF_3350]